MELTIYTYSLTWSYYSRLVKKNLIKQHPYVATVNMYNIKFSSLAPSPHFTHSYIEWYKRNFGMSTVHSDHTCTMNYHIIYL